jgi:hypothetical protein
MNIMKKRIIIGAVLFIITFASAFTNGVRAKVLPEAGIRNILSSELPLALLTNIKKEYKDYWITGLYKEGKTKKPRYFITVENADQVVKLSSDDSENWVIISALLKVNVVL